MGFLPQFRVGAGSVKTISESLNFTGSVFRILKNISHANISLVKKFNLIELFYCDKYHYGILILKLIYRENIDAGRTYIYETW